MKSSVLAAIVIFSLCGIASAQTKPPFTISKETTVITSPLRADGTPDYLAALNEKYGKGVTPENNAFVMWLKVIGTGDAVIASSVRERLLKASGAVETPAGADVWKSYQDDAKARGITGDALNNAEDELSSLGLAPWNAADHPDVANYLKNRAELLAITIEASKRPRWWIPYIAPKSDRVVEALLPSLGILRQVANTLDARSMMRMRAGDVNGAIADAMAAKRLGRHAGGGATLIEHLVGVSIDVRASRTLGAIIGSGKLSVAQCDAIAAALKQLPPMVSSAESIGTGERWSILDMVEMFATAQQAAIWDALGRSGTGDVAEMKFNSIDRSSVDWDVVFKMVNKNFDDFVHAAAEPDFAKMSEASMAVDKQIAAMKSTTTDSPRKDLKMLPGETREAYSTFVGQEIMLVFMPSLGKAEELSRRANLREEMTGALLVAATAKARTGKWPATLEELVLAGLPKVPRDFYAPDGRLKYIQNPNGTAMIYSLGPNKIDDGGVEDSAAKKDDITVGTK